MMYGTDNGFLSQMEESYKNTDLYDKSNEVFSYMPIVAIVNKVFFLVHGGINERIVEGNPLKISQLPINESSPATILNFVSDLLWSDPAKIKYRFGPNFRGSGVTFGEEAVIDFLKKYNYQAIIRAHQFFPTGINDHFDGKCITVFSNSNYIPGKPGVCGILLINGVQLQRIFLPSVPFVKKSDIQIFDVRGINLGLLKTGQNLFGTQIAIRKASTGRKKIQMLSNSHLNVRARHGSGTYRFPNLTFLNDDAPKNSKFL